MESFETKKPFSVEALRSEGVTVIKEPEAVGPVELALQGIESKYPKQADTLRRAVQRAAEFCNEFIAYGIMTDNFADHGRRREWRHTMHAKYGATFTSYYEKNKLRINNVGGVKSWLDAAASSLRVFSSSQDMVQAVASILERFPDLTNYDDLTNEQKVELVRQADDLCREFIELFKKH